jgi:hypothetical protein
VSLIDVSDLAKAVGYLADAIGKLGDSIAHLASLGVQAWDAASARMAVRRFQDISADLTLLLIARNDRIIGNLDQYIYIARYRNDPDMDMAPSRLTTAELQQAWSEVLSRIRGILVDVRNVIDALARERSDLVIQEVYADLLSTLQDRITLLGRLSQSSAPTFSEEIIALEDVLSKYRTVRENLERAIRALNAYIHDSAKGPTRA